MSPRNSARRSLADEVFFREVEILEDMLMSVAVSAPEAEMPKMNVRAPPSHPWRKALAFGSLLVAAGILASQTAF
ncbi:hypothetical protein [uncultured Enterovirga sp.]|uniref:hypothetical protein n=1 Tax=uncultured Enterovirga sp. TaxID=2026352 RepID=UPI0035CB082F